jgi:hypothetical protein
MLIQHKKRAICTGIMLVLTAFVGMATNVSAEEVVAEANGPYEGYECQDMFFDATGSTEVIGMMYYNWTIKEVEYSYPEIIFDYLWQDDYDGLVDLNVSYAGMWAFDNAQVTIFNVPPVITSVSGPSVQAINEPFDLSAGFYDGFWDPTRGLISSTDTFTASFDWGDGTIDNLGEDQINLGDTQDELSWANSSHTYEEVGVYIVIITILDDDGGIATYEWLITVYDPAWGDEAVPAGSGFVTGGGWINVPAGSYLIDPDLSGKATFGFVSKYHKGQNIPDGNTEFQFRAANMNFHSHTYQWLIVAGSLAMYKGNGTINGEGNYGFKLTARDGQVNGGGGEDTFRIQIWNITSGDDVFDNQGDTELGGGQITIHKT